MKEFGYFFRKFKYDVLSGIVALTLSLVAFQYVDDPRIALLLSVIIIFVFTTVIIYLRHRDRDFYFLPLTSRNDKDNWIGSGRFEYVRSHGCFIITNASPGYIYAKCLNWSEYNFSFDFKALNFGGGDLAGLGVVVRAVNLSNYAMMQIARDGIRPHIRINGGWHVQGHQEANLSFNEPLSLDRFYHCRLTCENDSINIRLYNQGQEFFNRTWNIPQGGIEFHYKVTENAQPVRIPFPITLEYGSIGFRNYGNEAAIVKNVLVEKL